MKGMHISGAPVPYDYARARACQTFGIPPSQLGEEDIEIFRLMELLDLAEMFKAQRTHGRQ